MKFLKQVYSITSGSRRYRKLKALQFYANLRLRGCLDDSFETAKKKLRPTKISLQYSKQDAAPICNQESINSHEVDDSFELAKKHYKEKKQVNTDNTLKQKKIKKNDKSVISPLKKQSKKQSLSSSQDSDQELIEQIESELQVQTKPNDFSKYQLPLPNGDILVFMQNKQRMVITGEFEVCCLYGQIRVNGLNIQTKFDLSDQQKIYMHKVSSLTKNSLLAFDTLIRDSTINDQKNAPKLLEYINHNIILINGKSDCDKLIDKICENYDDISARFAQGYHNILYIHHKKVLNHSLIPFKIINVFTTAKEISSSQNYIQWTTQQEQFVDNAVQQFSSSLNKNKQLQQDFFFISFFKYLTKIEIEIIYLELVCGSKNCGKSMFSLYTINRLLDNFDRICVLDTDLGQSLFHFPGTVNLFSMSKKDIHLTNLTHIHFIKPVLSVFVGEYSPQYFIQQYIAGIKKCFKFYQEYFRNCPLVINTHGYVTNIGELLLYEIQDILEPQFIALLSTNDKLLSHLKDSNLRLDRLAITQKSKDIPHAKSTVADLTNHAFDTNKVKVNEAKRHRKDEIIFQYLTNQVKLDNTYPFQQLYNSHYGQLCLQKPFEVAISAIKYYLLDNQQQIEGSNEVGKHFNCSIVALFDSSFSFANPTSNCIGFAFIRDIDLKKNTLEIITSQSIINDLPRVSTFIKSSEIAFSKHFYLQNQNSYNEISELTYDINADFSQNRSLEIPFVLSKSCGLGNISFRTRVSNRK